MLRKAIIGVLGGGAAGAAWGYYSQCSSGACPLISTWWAGALYGGLIGLVLAVWPRMGCCACGTRQDDADPSKR